MQPKRSTIRRSLPLSESTEAVPKTFQKLTAKSSREAVGTRSRQMEEKLRERGREFRLRDSSVDLLREILQHRA